MLSFIVQYLEKYSSTIQQPASRGWHQVNRQEELLVEFEGSIKIAYLYFF